MWRIFFCRILAGALLVVLLAAEEGAQTGSPFDLLPRLDSATQQTLTIPVATQRAAAPAQEIVRNPFDLIGREQVINSEIADAKALAQEEMLALPTPTSIGSTASSAARGKFDAILCFVLMLLLTVGFVLQGGAFRKLVEGGINDNLLARLQREQRKIPYYIWAVLGIIVMGSFVFAGVRQVNPEAIVFRNWLSLDMFILGTLLLVIAKASLLELIKGVFPLAKPVEGYQTLLLVWTGLAGVFLFPFLVMVCFSSPVLAKAAAYSGFGLLVVGIVVLGLRALAKNIKLLAIYPLHFFLYICALEIGPLAVVVKLLVG